VRKKKKGVDEAEGGETSGRRGAVRISLKRKADKSSRRGGLLWGPKGKWFNDRTEMVEKKRHFRRGGKAWELWCEAHRENNLKLQGP